MPTHIHRTKHLENDVAHARDRNEKLKHYLKINQDSEADKVRTELNIFKALVLQKFESMEEIPKESESEKKTKKNKDQEKSKVEEKKEQPKSKKIKKSVTWVNEVDSRQGEKWESESNKMAKKNIRTRFVNNQGDVEDPEKEDEVMGIQETNFLRNRWILI